MGRNSLCMCIHCAARVAACPCAALHADPLRYQVLLLLLLMLRSHTQHPWRVRLVASSYARFLLAGSCVRFLQIGAYVRFLLTGMQLRSAHIACSARITCSAQGLVCRSVVLVQDGSARAGSSAVARGAGVDNTVTFGGVLAAGWGVVAVKRTDEMRRGGSIFLQRVEYWGVAFCD